MPFHIGGHKPTGEQTPAAFVFRAQYRLVCFLAGVALVWVGGYRLQGVEFALKAAEPPKPMLGPLMLSIGVVTVLVSFLPAAWVRGWESRTEEERLAGRRKKPSLWRNKKGPR